MCGLRGENIDPQTQNGKINYLGLENIDTGTGKIVGEITTECHTIKSVKNVFYQNDILYGKLRPNLNKVHHCFFEGICSTDILVIVPNENILGKLLYHYLISKNFNDKVLETVSGQQLPRTSWGKMGNIKIPVPPLAKQQEIVSEIEGYEAEIARLETMMAKSADAKKAILTKYL